MIPVFHSHHNSFLMIHYFQMVLEHVVITDQDMSKEMEKNLSPKPVDFAAGGNEQ